MKWDGRTLSPIDRHCNECTHVDNQQGCKADNCIFYGYRFGQGRHSEIITRVYIQTYCEQCHNMSDMHDCKFSDCDLYNYRKGVE